MYNLVYMYAHAVAYIHLRVASCVVYGKYCMLNYDVLLVLFTCIV